MKVSKQFKTTLLGALVALCSTTEAQLPDFSQDWGSYIKYVDMARAGQTEKVVNEFTGAVNYGFKVYDLNTPSGVFPIHLTYSSRGVKVDEYSSNVGLGWNLSAGGSITKITRGLDDDFVNAAGQPIGYNFPPPQARNAMTAYYGTVDCEKDYFVFNAFGMSGSFFYNASHNNYIPMNGEDLVITKEIYGQNQQRFVVRDNMNNTYYFELRETISTYINNESNPRHTADGNWFLTKVVLADKKEIALQYESKVIPRLKTSHEEFQLTYFPSVGSCPKPKICSGGEYGEQESFNTFNSYRIKNISFSEDQIIFRYSATGRTDVAGDFALNEIEVQRRGIMTKKYVLEQSYRSSRLMLDRIMDYSGGFAYALPAITLHYNTSYTIPPPFSQMSQDLMGYFNGEGIVYNCMTRFASQPTLVKYHLYPDTIDIVPGAVRGLPTNIDIQSALMLRKVEKGFGLIQEIEYEQNDCIDSVALTNSLVFGLRVKRTTEYTTSEPNKKIYTDYIYKEYQNQSTGVRLLQQTDRNIGATTSGCGGVYRVAGSRNRVTPIMGLEVVYRAVKIVRYTDVNNRQGTIIGARLNRYSISHASKFANHMWGNLTASINYTATGMVVDSVNYIYQYVSSTAFTGVYPYLFTYLPANGSGAGIAALTYEMIPGYKVLKETRHYQFNTAGQPLKTTKTVYTYNINYHQLTQADYYVNNILMGRTRYKRAYDYTTTGGNVDPNVLAIVYMNNHGMRGAIIEEINTRVDANAEHMLSGNITMPRYESTLDVVLPSIQLNYKTHTPCLYSNYNWLNVSGGTPVYDTHYETAMEILKVDEHVNPVETRINNKDYTCGLSMPMGQTYASFIDARADETGFMGFEDYELRNTTASGLINNNWTVNLVTCLPLVRSAAHAYTGKYGLNMSACLGLVFTFNKSLDAAKTYYIQYWIKSGSLNVVPNTGTVSAPLVLATNNGWTLVERTITGATNISVGSPTAVVDDIRLFPQGAAFNYANFDQLDRKVSECADNGNCTYYEYDPLNRLIIIRNNERNIIKKIEYGIQEQQ